MKFLRFAAAATALCATLFCGAATVGDTSADGTYVYLYNSAGWNTPTVWAWNETQNNLTSNTQWPGDAMTLVGDNLWKWTAPGNVPTKIIFSNSGNSKTGDLDYVNKATYDCSGQIVTEGGDDPSNPPVNPDDPVDPRPVEPGTNLITDYYLVNPNGQVGSNRSMTISVNNQKSSTALSNWTEADLIAQGVARDVCQAFRGTHERPIVDSYALYAAYDAQYLYLGVQYVYTVWDEWGEGFQAGESKVYNFDGDLMIVFDLDPEKSWDGTLVNGNSVWKDATYTTFANGIDCMWHGSTKPGVGEPALFFPNASGKADYNDASSTRRANVLYGYADGLLPSISAIYGQKSFGYDPALLEGNEGFVDLSSEVSRLGGNSSAHTFYEFRFPLSDLGITENYIKVQGIGVMVVDMYGASAHSTLPYDPSMYDNVFKAYSKDESSSAEKEDTDVVTYACARIGRMATSSIDEIQLPSPEASEADMPVVYYNLQGVPVANPLPGQLLIRRQGNTATKVIF